MCVWEGVGSSDDDIRENEQWCVLYVLEPWKWSLRHARSCFCISSTQYTWTVPFLRDPATLIKPLLGWLELFRRDRHFDFCFFFWGGALLIFL